MLESCAQLSYVADAHGSQQMHQCPSCILLVSISSSPLSSWPQVPYAARTRSSNQVKKHVAPLLQIFNVSCQGSLLDSLLPRDTKEVKASPAGKAAKKNKVAGLGGGGKPNSTAPGPSSSASSGLATPAPKDAQSEAGSASTERKMPKGRGKGARIPVEPQALLQYEGFDDIKTLFDSAMQKLKEPPFNTLCPSPAEAKEIETKTKSFVTDLNKWHKMLITMDGKMAKRQNTPVEALNILRGLKNNIKKVCNVFYDSSKKSLEVTKLQGLLDSLTESGFTMAPVIIAKVTRAACIDAMLFGKWDELRKILVSFSDAQEASEEILQKYVDGIFDLGLTKLIGGFAGYL